MMEPTFMIDEKMLPEIKDWKVGHRYTISMEVEQVGLNKGEQYPIPKGEKMSKKMEARFRIISAMAGEESEDVEDMMEKVAPEHKKKMTAMHNRMAKET